MTFTNKFQPVALGDTNLFKPVKVGGAQLNHRVVLAPLTRCRGDYNDNTINTELTPEYYSQRSQEPGTLIITEAAFPNLQSGGYEGVPGLFTEEQLKSWIGVFDKIHKNKSIAFTQIWSAGRNADLNFLARRDLRYDSASEDLYIDKDTEEAAAKHRLFQHGISKQEIKEYESDWITAARKIIEAGADGVEVHAANGFLLNQFLDPISNQRTDEYGGSIENRSRFPLEVIDGLIDVIGASKVGIRFSPYGVFGGMSGENNPLLIAQYSHIIGALEKRANEGKRLAYIHLVEPCVTTSQAAEDADVYSGGTNEFIYSIWKGLIIRCGDLALHPELAKEFLKDDHTLLAYGRFFISNPDLPYRLREGLPLTEYNKNTFYFPDAAGYTDYPNYNECLKLGY